MPDDLLDLSEPLERNDFLAREWPRDYLISEGLLALQGGSILIGGEAGKGKSILALQVAHELATGSPFLGLVDVLRPARVWIVQFEMAPAIYQERVLKVRDSFPMYAPGYLFISNLPYMPVAEDETQAWLIDRIQTRGIEVLVIDPIYQLGFTDENDAGSVALVLGGLKNVMAETGVSVILTYHTRKPQQGQGGQRRAGAMHEIRGSTHFTAWPDTVAVIQDGGTKMTLRFAKTRTAPEPVGDLRLELDRERLLFTATFVDPQRELSEAKIIEVLRRAGGRVSRDALRQEFNVSPSTFDRAVARLKKGGLTQSVPDPEDKRKAWIVLSELN